MKDKAPEARGRSAVETALIEAAADLLAEVGPARVSVRDIADRAGVNKGQIHHYFGGKQQLIEAAFRRVATEHFENANERSGDGLPVPLTLGLDQRYLQSVVRMVLDGDLETARLEFDEGISVPRSAIDRLASAAGDDEPSERLKGDLAAVMALELGWAAFAPFIQMAVRAETQSDIDSLASTLRRHVNSVFSSDDGQGAAST